MIKLNNFVTVNIDKVSTSITNNVGTRDTVVLINNNTNISDTVLAEGTYDELPTFTGASAEVSTLLTKYFNTYFNNGGKKIHYINVTTTNPLKTILENLSSDEIVICCTNPNTVSGTTETPAISAIYDIVKSNTGCDEKICIGNVSIENATSVKPESYGYVLKVGEAGIEMAAAAYLSKLDVDNSTLQDYCFTSENIEAFKVLNPDQTTYNYNTVVVDDNDIFKAIKETNSNVMIDIDGDVRNYGGNMSDGNDLSNAYAKILLTQTLTSKLVALLKTKLKYDSTSLARISAVITSEMTRYNAFGYLSMTKTWTSGDVYDASGNYLVLSNNTVFDKGYQFTILPLSSLDATARGDHELPGIYLFIADSYSIRQIAITGKVF